MIPKIAIIMKRSFHANGLTKLKFYCMARTPNVPCRAGWSSRVCVCVNRTNWDARPNVREHWTTSFSVLVLRSFAWLLPLRFGSGVWDTFGRVRSTLYHVDLGVGIFSDLAKRNFLYLIWKFISLLVATLISCRRVDFMLRLLVLLVRLHFTNELHRLRRTLGPPVAAKTRMPKRN